MSKKPSPPPSSQDLDMVCINTLRVLAADAVQRAQSGHPGLPMGAAPMAYVLWQWHLKHHPTQPDWPDRDRFVLSAGHGSMLLYALLHVTGYDVTLEDLQSFRQRGSRTPGHPEAGLTPGVEATTGPLGQGAANAVGMAMAERWLAHHFNRPGHTVVDHRTYALVSDGDLMEGVTAEASSLAGHLKLGKLTYLYDANQVSLDGPTALSFTEDVGQRYASYGWHVITLQDGDTDLDGIHQALQAAAAETQRPSLLIVPTTLGYGSPNKQGTSACHGSPLGEEEVRLVKQRLGFDPEKSFEIPAIAQRHFHQALMQGQRAYAHWQAGFQAYGHHHPELVEAWHQAMTYGLPAGWQESLPSFETESRLSTREISGRVLNALAKRIPYVVGGDADLSCSTLSGLSDEASFEGLTGAGRNIHFGVREHAMGAIANGMAYHGGVRPYTSTFFVFSDYMRPALRLAALSKLATLYIWTHDSIGLGEDGPTHQPVEHLMSLRAMPNFCLIRPADALETLQSWQVALQHTHGPVALVLTRQKLGVLPRPNLSGDPQENPHEAAQKQLGRGAYVFAETPDPLSQQPHGIIIATGSEVHIGWQAYQMLTAQGWHIRLVSMPSWELFMAQDQAYQDAILPPCVTARLAIEAGISLGWERWVGSRGLVLGLSSYGASAPAETLWAQFKFTAQHACEMMRRLL